MPQQEQAGTAYLIEVKLMTELNDQLRRAKVINVPHYDPKNDRFIFDDGRVVQNNDPVFDRFKWN